MANALEYVISLKDKASAIADQVSKSFNNIQDSTEKVTAGATAMQAKLKSALGSVVTKAKEAVKGPAYLSNSIEELKNKLESVNKVRFGTVLKSEFDKASKEAKKLEQQISRLQSGISGNGIGSKIAGWREDFASSMPGADLIKNPLTMAGAAIGGFWVATQKAMDAGKEKMKLQTLTGSAEIGASLYDGLTKFATDTVFGSEVYDMGVQMLANGIKDTDVMPVMKQLGDLSMGDANKLGSLSLAFAQISGKGKLAGQELLQLQSAGFNPLEVLFKNTGESMESLQDRMSKGQIGIEEVRKAMDLATGPGGNFHNMLEEVANTPYGQLEGLRGQLDAMMIKIGEVFIPIASKMILFFSWLGEKLGPILQPLAMVIGVVSVALLGLAAAQWFVNLAVWSFPGIWIILIIVAIISAIAYLIMKIDGWGEAWKHTMNGSKLLLSAFVGETEVAFNRMVDNIMIGINRIKEGWYKFKNAVGMGDESANNEMLAQINADTEQRKKSILEGAEKMKTLYDESNKEFGLAGKSLKWNKGTNIEDLKKKIGIEPPKVPGTNLNEDNKTTTNKEEGKKTNEAIATGGQKNTTINISFKNMMENTTISKSGFKETVNEMEEQLQNAFLRVLAMANTTAG